MSEFKREYAWAANKTKLAQSITALELKKKIDPSFEITEASIKEEYAEKRGGLTIDEAPEEAEEAPARRGRKPKAEDDSEDDE